jgi:hypothetical protein
MPEEVVAVKGVVVAGRERTTKKEHLQRHLSDPPYDIDFLTLDDLATSLMQISRELVLTK